MNAEIRMWRCAWRANECRAMVVVHNDRAPHGWAIIRCEDGEDRVFCPKHVDMLRRPEEDPHG